MRIAFRFGVLLLLAASTVCAQTPSRRVCVIQNDEGYDALRLARQLSTRTLASGDALSVVAITGKPLPPDEERDLRQRGAQFTRVTLPKHDAKTIRAESKHLRCDYDVKVWYHKSVDTDMNPPAGIPGSAATGPQPMGDRTVVGYELRDARSNKMLAHAAAPPRTVYVTQGRRLFDPYPLFANQIIKKLNSLE